MTEWDERVEGHTVFQTLRQLSTALEKADDSEPEAEVQDSLYRLRRGRDHISDVLDRTDPILIPLPVLENVNTHLQNVRNEVNSYASNGKVAHLNNAQTHLEKAIQQSQLIPSVTTEVDLDAIRSSIVDYRRSAGQHVRYLEEEVNRIRTQVEDLEKRTQQQSNEIESQKARLDQAIQNFVDQSSEARERQSSQFSEVLSNAKAEFANVTEQGEELLKEEKTALKESADDVITKLKEDAQSAVDSLDQRREEAADIVGVIARTGMAGGYQQEADQERKDANFWRWIAVGSMFGIIGMAIWMVVTATTGAFSIGPFSGKAFASLAFGILAAYGARNSNRNYLTREWRDGFRGACR